MSQKYAAFDEKLFKWLAENRKDVTTSLVNQALSADTTTLQRHVSRRFTQLEDRGILECRLEGTTRICTVVKDLPTTLAKPRWRPGPGPESTPAPTAGTSLAAENSEEFIAAGGTVEQLPASWDRKPTINAIGLIDFVHVLAAME